MLYSDLLASFSALSIKLNHHAHDTESLDSWIHCVPCSKQLTTPVLLTSAELCKHPSFPPQGRQLCNPSYKTSTMAVSLAGGIIIQNHTVQ